MPGLWLLGDGALRGGRITIKGVPGQIRVRQHRLLPAGAVPSCDFPPRSLRLVAEPAAGYPADRHRGLVTD